MRLRWYYEQNLRSFFISKFYIKTLSFIPEFKGLNIIIRPNKQLSSEGDFSRLLFWVLLGITGQRPYLLRKCRFGFTSRIFSVDLRRERLYQFFDKFYLMILPISDDAVLFGYSSGDNFTRFQDRFNINFIKGNIQEYFEIAEVINLCSPYLRVFSDLTLRFNVSLLCCRKLKYAACLLRMVGLPVRFRI